MSKIVIVGVATYEMYSYVSRFPKSGETISGDSLEIGFGGKGANQAIIAQKMGAKTSLISTVGDDDFGKQVIQNLVAYSVPTDHVRTIPNKKTGISFVDIDKDGNSYTVIHAGVTKDLTSKDIEEYEEVFKDAKVVLCQLEISVDVALKALELGKKHGAFTILNPTPGLRDLPDQIFKLTDLLCPNTAEAENIIHRQIETSKDTSAAGKDFLKKGVPHVVITMGGKGSLYRTEKFSKVFPAPQVNVIDKSGCGDAFVGSLAAFIAEGMDIEKAIEFATLVATEAVKRKGSVSFCPKRDELEFLKEDKK
ncbi:ribokinase [Anaeramoeba ignava]|uniref:Ribokinase n=1 Tax=Anaeramoeba ignava TaxID=1746090 RepID=A0A9Q0RFI7_ANAIG|nr:ribokinase [Anaeramoeba ignava]